MKRSIRLFSRILTTVMVLTLILTMGIASSAAGINQAVTDAKSGVVQIQIWFSDPEAAVETALHTGTGFLINESTVVTCDHVVTGFSKEWYVQWAQQTNEMFGLERSAEQIKDRLEIRISIYRDVYIRAKIQKSSGELDYAILNLDDQIKDRKPIAIRNSSDLKQTEEVFALGFPGDISNLDSVNYYDADDVTITSGRVNKVAEFTFSTEDRTFIDVNCIESSATITGGNSGGPLVDAEGNVVGINAAGNDVRNLAVSTSQLIPVLNSLGISYKLAGDETPSPETNDVTAGDDTSVVAPETNDAPAVEVNKDELEDAIDEAGDVKEDDYTEDSYKELKDAVKAAEKILDDEDATQKEVDKAAKAVTKAIKNLEKAEDEEDGEDGGNMMMFIIIGAIAVVIVVVVIIIAVASKSKKAAPAQAPAAAAPAQAPAYAAPAARPAAPVQAPTYSAPAPASDAGETTVLNQGAGETTVLSQAANGGYLVRERNNERVQISSSDFTIGRERSKVSYCISDNSSISRVHARFVVRGGNTYIVDNKAANGTFVNGVKLREGNETELKDGDKISLADEKFTFKK